jgi:triosephosphate isomerase (TIM)
MPRQKFVAGNWKMYTTRAAARDLAAAVARQAPAAGVRVAVCPPFPWLTDIAEVLKGSPVGLGAQNCYPEQEGPFTGEVSPLMLKDAGCRYVILGHSERRHDPGETDDLINRKVKLALATGLEVIFCVGELLNERDAGQTFAVLDRQLTAGMRGVEAGQLPRLVVGYEPVWAIGTGRTATPAQAQEAHAFLRRRFGELFGPATADALVIQYGGSVKPDNAADLMRQPDVDGALVGGASLKADSFLSIVQAALR